MSSISKKLLNIALMIVLIFVLAACGAKNENAQAGSSGSADAAGQSETANGEQRHKLRLGYLNVMDDAQTILAYHAGLYEKHGLDVEMKLFSSGTDLIKAIVGGQLDGGVLGFTNALTWLEQGADLKVVGGAQMGFHSVLVGAESGIDTVAQLKGKSVASQKPGSTADVVWNGVVLKSGNLGRQDVNMQYVSPAVAIQSLAAGKVDSAFVFEPYAAIAKLQYPVKEIYEIGQEWPFPCMVVITSGEILETNRDAVHRMLDAQKEAIEMLGSDPDKSAEYIVKEFIQEETLKKSDGTEVKATEVIADSIKSQTFNWELTEKDIATMQEIAKMMVEQGILEKEPDVTQALDLTWQKQQI